MYVNEICALNGLEKNFFRKSLFLLILSQMKQKPGQKRMVFFVTLSRLALAS